MNARRRSTPAASPAGAPDAAVRALPDRFVPAADLKRTGGGTYDPKEAPVSFVALSDANMTLAMDNATHVLIALDQLNSAQSFERLEALLNSNRHKVFLDSGIYSINAAYRRQHPEVSETFLIPPKKMPGFQELRDKYVSIASKYESKLWGYVELDQGGQAWKPKTRAELEKSGLRPMPVYHPMVDEPSYFDELAQSYDRICVGFPRITFARKRLIATVYERWQRYPHLWIHLLGIHPNQWLRAMPFSSCDSTTWTEAMRWGVFHEWSDGRLLGALHKNFMYSYDADPEGPDGARTATRIAMAMDNLSQRNWRASIAERRAAGLPTVPRDNFPTSR